MLEDICEDHIFVWNMYWLWKYISIIISQFCQNQSAAQRYKQNVCVCVFVFHVFFLCAPLNLNNKTTEGQAQVSRDWLIPVHHPLCVFVFVLASMHICV